MDRVSSKDTPLTLEVKDAKSPSKIELKTTDVILPGFKSVQGDPYFGSL